MELVAEQGLGAATAEIAKRAGVPNGSVFTYFDTKTALFNALYLELKAELTDTVSAVPAQDDTRTQLHHLWVSWTHWGASNPAKRRVLAQLSVSDQITELSRKAAYAAARPSLALIQRTSANGALRDAPLQYVGALVETLVATTTDFMIGDPARADEICEFGFEAVWRALR
jgi:AcrR family transcriptional regulator